MKLKSFKNKSDQTEIVLNNITVLVGPNNVGKSQTLRDIKNLLELGNNARPVIVSDADFDLPDNFDSFLGLLSIADSSQTIGNKIIRGLKSNMLSEDFIDFPLEPYRMAYNDINRRKKEIMGRFTKYFVTDLSSSNRLLLASSVDSVNPELKNPKKLLQSLFLDNTRELDLKQAFKDAFNMEITLDYSSMLKLCFRVAKIMPDIPEDPRKAYPITNKLGKIEEQGDGFRSLVGIILGLLFSKGRIVLLDEPEAFLHPAQARFLGKWIGDHKDIINGQLIISTHNANFLSGIIASGHDVDIFRLNRIGDNTTFNKVSSDATKTLFENPLLSSQRVMESVFYKGVVVCEADADRAIYQGVATINHHSNEDVLFIHSQNKQTLKIVAKLLKEANIPVALVADIDALNDQDILKGMISSTTDSHIPQSIFDLRKEIALTVNGKTDDQMLKALTTEVWYLYEQLVYHKHTLDGAKGALQRIAKGITSWSEIKSKGIEGFDAKIREKVLLLINDLKQYGVFIVPVGELEGWLNVGTKKKNKWIVPALEKVHNNQASPELIKFVGEILAYFN